MRHPMFLLLSATAAAAALFAYGTGSAADAAPSPASVEAYVAQARQLAGDDLKALLPLCQPQPAVRASGPAPAVERSLQVMETCGRAQPDRFLTM